jgi:hypothetical protein
VRSRAIDVACGCDDFTGWLCYELMVPFFVDPIFFLVKEPLTTNRTCDASLCSTEQSSLINLSV